MSADLKSSWELTLEKMNAQVGDSAKRLTPEQKQQIAEVRKIYQARIAEKEIRAQALIRQAAVQGEFARIQALQAELVEERRLLNEGLEQKLEQIRKQF